MTTDEAEHLLGLLVGATTGWTTAEPATFKFYTEQIRAFRDHDAAVEAVADVCRTWAEARRPPVAELNRAYTAVTRRRIMNTPALRPGASGRYPSIEEGRRIAAAAYADECARRPEHDPLIRSGYRSHEPSPTHLSAILGGTL